MAMPQHGHGSRLRSLDRYGTARTNVSSAKPPHAPRKAKPVARKRPQTPSGAKRSLAPKFGNRPPRNTPPISALDDAGDQVGLSVGDRLASVEENAIVFGRLKAVLDALQATVSGTDSAVRNLEARVGALEKQVTALRSVDCMQTSTVKMARVGLRSEFKDLYARVERNQIGIERIRAVMDIRVMRATEVSPVDPHTRHKELKAEARKKRAARVSRQDDFGL